MHHFEHELPLWVTEKFKELLSEKHLYQAVELDAEAISKLAKVIHEESLESYSPSFSSGSHFTPNLAHFEREGQKVIDRPWVPDEPNLPGAIPLTRLSEWSGISFQLPTIHTYCQLCKAHWPFNPLCEETSVAGDKKTPWKQWYFLAYQCQSCKGTPIRFLVSREGNKLRLSGRDPIEVLPTPKVLPNSVCKFYSDAQIAHNAGQTLAGLFLLRVFIEQFWRTTPAVKALLATDDRATGERQGDAYQSGLPVDFKTRFPSLKEVYGNLSAAMHKADASAIVHADSSEKIVEHFDARRLFRITDIKPPLETTQEKTKQSPTSPSEGPSTSPLN